MKPIRSTKDHSLSIFGLKIKLEVGIISLLLFIGTALGVGYQIIGLLRGARLHMNVDKKIDFVRLVPTQEPDLPPFLVVNANLSYTNNGIAGADAWIDPESLEIYIGSDVTPFEYGATTLDFFKPTNSGNYFDRVMGRLATSFEVKGNTSVDRQVTFAKLSEEPINPSAHAAYITWRELIYALEDGKDLRLTFLARQTNMKGVYHILMDECIVKSSSVRIESLKKNMPITAICSRDGSSRSYRSPRRR